MSPELIAVSLWNENVGWNCGWLSRNTGWGWTALTQGRRCQGNLSGEGAAARLSGRRGSPLGGSATRTAGGAGSLTIRVPALLQMRRLWTLIVDADPRQLQFDFALWTTKMVRELIRREFGFGLSVGRLLPRWE